MTFKQAVLDLICADIEGLENELKTDPGFQFSNGLRNLKQIQEGQRRIYDLIDRTTFVPDLEHPVLGEFFQLVHTLGERLIREHGWKRDDYGENVRSFVREIQRKANEAESVATERRTRPKKEPAEVLKADRLYIAEFKDLYDDVSYGVIYTKTAPECVALFVSDELEKAEKFLEALTGALAE